MSTTVEHEHPQLGFVRKYIFSTDHKVIGVQYIITAMFMAVVGGLLSMLMRMQLAWPTELSPTISQLFPTGMAGGVMEPGFYLSLVTMHGTIMVFFLFTAVLTGGFGNFLIPLQIGARDMAFPFLNALSYWTFLVSCVVILAALFVAGGPPLGGWTAYAPLSALPEGGAGQADGMTLWIIAIALFAISGLMGGLNYVTTLLTMRTKGMSMMRLPLTQWSIFITAVLGTLAFPVLLAAGILLLFDRMGGTSFFVPAGLVMGEQLLEHTGGNPLLWQHLFWFFGHPEVYIVLLPAMGIASDLLSTFCAEAHLQLPHDGVFDVGDRVPEFHRLGSPHVPERDEPRSRLRVHSDYPSDRHPVGRQDLQLGGYPMGGPHRVQDANAIRTRLRVAVRHRRAERHLPGPRRRRTSCCTTLILSSRTFTW